MAVEAGGPEPVVADTAAKGDEQVGGGDRCQEQDGGSRRTVSLTPCGQPGLCSSGFHRNQITVTTGKRPGRGEGVWNRGDRWLSG